jgi:hypothetical protein
VLDVESVQMTGIDSSAALEELPQPRLLPHILSKAQGKEREDARCQLMRLSFGGILETPLVVDHTVHYS